MDHIECSMTIERVVLYFFVCFCGGEILVFQLGHHFNPRFQITQNFLLRPFQSNS